MGGVGCGVGEVRMCEDVLRTFFSRSCSEGRSWGGKNYDQITNIQ